MNSATDHRAFAGGTLSKLSAPRVLDAVPRPRPCDVLNAFADRAAVWVEGPAGAGKTTVVAEAIGRRGAPSFWYHVDEADRDPSSFIAYLLQLSASPHDEQSGFGYLTPDHLADLQGFGRRFFREFFRRLPAGSVLVLDNCHRAESDGFHTLIRVACEEIPPGKQVILASRHHVPAGFAKLRLNRHIGLVSAEDLRLDLSETRALADAAGSRQSVDALQHTCDGWVAGVVLLLHREGVPGTADELLDLSTREALFDYFAGEILAARRARAGDFLLRTAVLPIMTPELARAVTGNPDAARELERLHRRHAFTSRREGESPVYAYHDLFRAFLLEHLEKTTEARDLHDLRIVAARALEAAGQSGDALEIYRQAGDEASIGRLVRERAQGLVDAGRLQTLDRWLSWLSPERIREDPWLLLFQGIAAGLTDPVRARVCCEQAYEAFVANGGCQGQFAAAFSVMEVMLVISETFKEWDRWIETMEALLESRPPENPARAVRAWYGFLYMCLYRRPDHRLLGSARQKLEHALFSGTLPSAQAIQAATGLLAYAHFSSDEPLAARALPELRRLLDSEHLAVFSRVWGSVWIAVYHFFDARYQTSLEWATVARDLARNSGLSNVSQIMSCYRLQSLGNLGRAAEALQEIESIRREIEAGGLYPRAYFRAVTGINLYFDGRYEAAIEAGAECLQRWRDNGFLIAEYAWTALQALYLVAAGRTDEAMDLVCFVERGLAGTLCNYLDPMLLILRSHHCLQRGDIAGASSHLTAALTMSRNRKRAAALSWARALLPTPRAVRGNRTGGGSQAGPGMGDQASGGRRTTEWPWPVTVELGEVSGCRSRAVHRPRSGRCPGGSSHCWACWPWPERRGSPRQGLRICCGRIRTAIWRSAMPGPP
ncbi:MAG: hypothetical protein IPK20_17515 [Betaproteobacteria bacterium]|nr:hypothetical protein [Betaproteobacteria bacterium]